MFHAPGTRWKDRSRWFLFPQLDHWCLSCILRSIWKRIHCTFDDVCNLNSLVSGPAGSASVRIMIGNDMRIRRVVVKAVVGTSTNTIYLIVLNLVSLRDDGTCSCIKTPQYNQEWSSEAPSWLLAFYASNFFKWLCVSSSFCRSFTHSLIKFSRLGQIPCTLCGVRWSLTITGNGD